MDLESIKVIADTATQLTGEAKQVFVWWLLGKEVLGMVLSTMGFIAVVVAIYRLIARHMSNNRLITYFKVKREELNTGCGGVLTDSEIERTIQAIEQRLKEANK